MPKNLNEPNQCCKEKCVKNPLQHCERQKKMYCSIKLLLLKMALQATESWGGLFHRTLWGSLFFIDCVSGLYVGLMLHVITCLFVCLIVCGGVFVNLCQCLHSSVSEHFSAWNAKESKIIFFSGYYLIIMNWMKWSYWPKTSKNCSDSSLLFHFLFCFLLRSKPL